MLSGLMYSLQLYMYSCFSIAPAGAKLSAGEAAAEAAADGAAELGAADGAADAGALLAAPPLEHAARNALVAVRPAAARKPRRGTRVSAIRRSMVSRSCSLTFVSSSGSRRGGIPCRPSPRGPGSLHRASARGPDRPVRALARSRPRSVLAADDQLARQIGLHPELGLVAEVGALMDASRDRRPAVADGAGIGRHDFEPLWSRGDRHGLSRRQRRRRVRDLPRRTRPRRSGRPPCRVAGSTRLDRARQEVRGPDEIGDEPVDRAARTARSGRPSAGSARRS